MVIVVQITNIETSIPDRNFKTINNEPSFLFLLRRIQELNEDIVVATSNEKIDDNIEEMARNAGVDVFRGSYTDIPRRLLGAVDKYDVSDFVRVPGNYPFVDTDKLIELYNLHTQNHYDYSFNENLKGVIWGMGCEVFNVDFLKKLATEKLTDTQRQTIGIYIRQNEKSYNVFEYHCYENQRPKYKLSIETERDYEVVSDVAENVKDIDCNTVTDYLSKHPISARHNLESRPKEVGLEKLFVHIEKTRNLIADNRPDDSYPVSVELTLTNACNMNCVYCSDAELRKNQGMSEQISIDDFERLFKDLSRGGTKGVVIEGGGEPTLYSKIDEVVKLASDYGLALGLITNGSVRLREDIISKFEWIRVSLDASTPKEYKALKGVDFYERVIDNIAYYAKNCPTVGVGYVVTKNNISQIEALVMRLRELKASYIQMRPVVDNEELYPKNVDLSYLEFYMTRGFGVQIDGMTDNAEAGNSGLPCYANSITSIISGDGSVFICGRLNIHDWVKPIGNIRRDSFSDIWSGEERRRQVEMIMDGNFCKENCPQCRVSKFNVLVNKVRGIKSVHFI